MQNDSLFQLNLAVQHYKRASAKLLKAVMQAEDQKIHLKEGYSSLFSMFTQKYGLTRAVAYDFITVARKSREVPGLLREIENKNFGVSKARKMSSRLNPKNCERWFVLAKEKSCRELERLVADECPQARKQSSIKALGAQNYRLKTDVTEETKDKLARVMEITGKNQEETMEKVLDFYLKHHCPQKKAERAQKKGQLVTGSAEGAQDKIGNSKQELVTGRKPIPAHVRHAVILRDQGQCTFKAKGHRCTEKRFLHLHHIRPVAQGGENTVENLKTLCSRHHAFVHEDELGVI